jgi:hypothetical protein
MTTPARYLSLAPNLPTRRGWLGLSLSILCFVHCVGSAALVPLLPAAFSLLIENEGLEWALVGISAALAGRLVWNERRRLQRWQSPFVLAWAALTALGGIGLVVESEGLLQTSLALLALLQLAVLVLRHRGCRY